MSAFPDYQPRSRAFSHEHQIAMPGSMAASLPPTHLPSTQHTMRWNPPPSREVTREPKLGERRPTYFGYIKTPADAILLLAACDLPDVPSDPRMDPPPRRISRRLLDDERASLIRSGAIFVWDEREAGMRRWTDGHCWSASRVSGCFLTYRELEMRKKNTENAKEAPRGNLYKQDGLIKQSFNITTASNRKLHVISYYLKNDIRMGNLQRVSRDPRITGKGPGSWNVKVDEEEFGELLNRESERLPKHVVLNNKQAADGVDEKHGMKRTFSDDSSSLSSPTPEEQEQAFHTQMAPRNAPVTYPPFPRYTSFNHSYLTREDNMAVKRYRYDRSNSPPYTFYPEHRAWASRYETPTHMSPLTPPLSKSPVPIGYNPHPNPAPHAYSVSRPQLPPLHYPRASEAEKGTLEALASLRAEGSRYPTHPATLPHNTTVHGPIRPRFAPVSATDRHTLQKLSVPM